MHYSKELQFLLHCAVFKCDKFRTHFLIKHALSTLGVHYLGLHIYDPLHLHKCTGNLFLKYDVQLEFERMDSHLPVFAKWEHIEKLYMQMLYKLTPTCPLLLSVL